MKNICVFLMFVLFVYGGFSVYATTDIAADAESSECVENITGTYSGDANFKAKWTPNNIQLNWYNNNTLMQGVNTESNTCDYGTTLTIPTTPPERPGYEFTGWKIRPKFDFSKLAPGGSNAITGSLSSGETWTLDHYDNYNYCHNNNTNVSCISDNEFQELGQQEWKVEFRSGTTTGVLYGSAYCSARSGNNSDHTYTNDSANWLATYNELEIATGQKGNCWCQATGWKPYSNNPNGIIYGPSSVSTFSVWVFDRIFSESDCFKKCAYNCAHYVLQGNSRRALFIGDGN